MNNLILSSLMQLVKKNSSFIITRRRLKAFTLAEILITLSIIGVIASMTIPSLVQDVQDAQLKASGKKIYSDLSQAGKRLSLEKGGSLKGLFTTYDIFRDSFLTYMNYTKKCNAGTPLGLDGCWHSADGFYSSFGVPYNGTGWVSYSRAILNNGALLIFGWGNVNCSSTSVPTNDNCGEITFDVNGYKGPNVVGKDIYDVWVLKSGKVMPLGSQGDAYYNSCSAKHTGWGCLAKDLYQ